MINILVAEDNELIRKLIEAVLSKEGFKIDICTNGREALEKLKRANYNLVISDENMTEVRGSELAIYIKNTESMRHIPVIIVSAEANTEPFRKLLEQNVISCFIPKPFQTKSLINIVNVVLKNSLRSQTA